MRLFGERRKNAGLSAKCEHLILEKHAMTEEANRGAGNRCQARWKNPIRCVRDAPLLVAACYTLAGLVWIVASDWVLNTIAKTTGILFDEVTYYQTIKGMLVHPADGGAAFFLIRRYMRILQRSQDQMQARLEGNRAIPQPV